MPGPHKHRRDVPDYDGSYDPTDLGPQGLPQEQRPSPVRREVMSTPRNPATLNRPPAQPVHPPERQEHGPSAQTYLVMTGVSAAVLAVCAVALGVLLLRMVAAPPDPVSVVTLETLPETMPVTEQIIPETEPTEPPETAPPETEPPATEPPETEPPETETERPRTWDALYEELLGSDTTAWGARFDVLDVDGNGTPELFVSEGEFTDAPVKIYTVQDETAILVGEIRANDGEVTVVPEQHQILWTSGAWPKEFHVYLLNETAFTERELMTYQLGVDGGFTINGASVSIYEFSRTYMSLVNQPCVQHIGRKFSLNEVEKLPQKAASHSAEKPFFDDPWWENYQTEPTTEAPKPTRPPRDSSSESGIFDGFDGILDYFR